MDRRLHAKDILKESRAEGISPRTLNRAKKKLGIQSIQTDSQWVWSPPAKIQIDGKEIKPKEWIV